MRTSDVAPAYACTLFELASLADSVDDTDRGLASAAEAVRASLDLRSALTDASVPAETKRGVLRDIFGDAVTPEALALVTLLVERGHTELLGDVARSFGEIAEKERGIVVAEVTTAVPLTDALRASLTAKLVASLGRPVSLRENVDASILGGVVIEVAGRVLDGSVASQLEEMRRTLVTTPGGEDSR
jgi:F-type H+-transporting ATPase subunit delta